MVYTLLCSISCAQSTKKEEMIRRLPFPVMSPSYFSLLYLLNDNYYYKD